MFLAKRFKWFNIVLLVIIIFRMGYEISTLETILYGLYLFDMSTFFYQNYKQSKS